MRLILSRKGFDTTSGGCASPIFPDGSMIALPIPDRTSPVRYRDLAWRGRNLGELVESLTRGRIRSADGAHLDPDLRPALRPRRPGWRPLLGQRASAQGHLRNAGVGRGDLFLFWGLFREVDAQLRFSGPPLHVLWGWLQIGEVADVDTTVRGALHRGWRWAAEHPHLSLPRGGSNTLYVAADALGLGGPWRGAGAFDSFTPARQLTAPGARGAGRWSLPRWFLPRGRPPLTYHRDAARWSRSRGGVLLRVASRGQEFVLDASRYPEATGWVAGLLGADGGTGPLLPCARRRSRRRG